MRSTEGAVFLCLPLGVSSSSCATAVRQGALPALTQLPSSSCWVLRQRQWRCGAQAQPLFLSSLCSARVLETERVGCSSVSRMQVWAGGPTETLDLCTHS